MTHLRLLDQLIHNAESLLRALKRADAEAIDRLSDERERTLEALREMGDLDPDHPDGPLYVRRLETLEDLNNRVLHITSTLHAETRRRLSGAARGRRGIAGYQKTLGAGRARGARHEDG